MITYDSHSWRTFLRTYGSVFPSACLYALPPTIVALVLKILDNDGIVEVSEWELVKQSAAWGSFTGTVGFLLVFRTGQCYARFLSCASSVYNMRTQMHEAYAGLVAFCCMSKASKKDQSVFHDKLIHLFSTLHACALASVCGSSHHLFNIVDIEHMPPKFIQYLKEVDSHQRVELAYQWINNLIVKEIASGLLNVPPPILSRVFQALEKSMVEYNTVVMYMSIPFPFPYSQACIIMMFVHVTALPLIVVGWTGQPVSAAMLTFLSAACFLSLEMISAELENPFGDDANDLPITEIHNHFNDSLQLLMHPSLKEDFLLKKHRASDLFRAAGTKQLDDFEAAEIYQKFRTSISEHADLGDESSEGKRAEVEVIEIPMSFVGSLESRDSKIDSNTAAEEEGGEDEQVIQTPMPPPAGSINNDSAHQAASAPPVASMQQAAPAEHAAPSQEAAPSQQAAPLKLAASPPAEAKVSPKRKEEVPSEQNVVLTNHLQAMTTALLELPWMSDFQQRQTKFEEDMLRRLDEIVSELKTARAASRKQGVPSLGTAERLESSRQSSLQGSAVGSKRPSVESRSALSPRPAREDLWVVPKAPHSSKTVDRHEIPWPAVNKPRTPVCRCCASHDL